MMRGTSGNYGPALLSLSFGGAGRPEGPGPQNSQK